jgi:hypothetical protein
MIDADLRLAWFKELELPSSFGWFNGPRQPEYGNGDLVGLVTDLEGPGEDLEGMGDWGSFQVRLVGREFELPNLRASAFLVDSSLRFGDYPADLWGTRIRTVTRTGGQPSVLLEDDLDRVAYVCTYLAHEVR